MQEHLRTARKMPRMGTNGCADWMMIDPHLMGSGMMGESGYTGCGWLGHAMMGPEQGWWAMPSGMTPDRYARLMQGTMQQMHQQMAAIASEKDPTNRQALIPEHYKSMYRSMQTMRGMDWMWAPNTAASLPKAESPGARLVTKYCSQCHPAPSPVLHTNAKWSAVTSRMREHIHDVSGSAMPALKIPSVSERDTINEYLGKHAAAAH